MIYPVDGRFVISSGGVWLPGVYDTRRAATYAFRFSNVCLETLAEANEVITFELLRELNRSGHAACIARSRDDKI